MVVAETDPQNLVTSSADQTPPSEDLNTIIDESEMDDEWIPEAAKSLLAAMALRRATVRAMIATVSPVQADWTCNSTYELIILASESI